MMLRSRKSLAPAECDEFNSASTGRAKKRRVLSDITNVSASFQIKNDSKKPAVPKKTPSPVIDALKAASENDPILSDREYMRRVSDDIDLRDTKNPNLATCYVKEMYDNFAVLEKKFSPSATYMSSQPYITERMRATLVDWLVSLNYFAHISI